MTQESSFDSKISINSDEEINQLKICPFQTHFQYCYQGNTQNKVANQPIPSPEYKFMGVNYSNNEIVNYCQSIERKLDNSKQQDQIRKQFTINVNKSVDICSDNKRIQKSNKIQIYSMQQIKMNKQAKKNVNQNNNLSLQKPRKPKKNTTTNIKNLSPHGILKASSFEGLQSHSSNNLSYQMFSNKKVQFEFTQEQIKSMKKIKIENVLIRQRTRFVLN
ncbi:unnamed protein product [Paramecium sonneborni]|uniref:Uncharacterized protein n=1 Tax=Paramecium sonneborni TaxID=65129 RepID=A0A8S1QZC6_9CILI|nr:unnamed protein product [Paramecium sonneborni]